MIVPALHTMATNAAAATAAPVVAIHWFRKGLRLHDNPALTHTLTLLSAHTHTHTHPAHTPAEAHAHTGASSATHAPAGSGGVTGSSTAPGSVLYPVFILDPWFAGEERVCANRYNFMLECLQDLDASLRELGSRLFVVQGKPAEVMPRLLEEWGVNVLTYERDTEPYAIARDKAIRGMAEGKGVRVDCIHGHTMWDPQKLLAACKGDMPATYQSFIKLASSLGAPPKPLPAPKRDQIPPGSRCRVRDGEHIVPTLASLGYNPANVTTSFRGGEREALARLERHMARTEWVAAFEKPDTSPNSLEPSTTVLSPHLKFGALSCRTFYWALQDVFSRLRGRAHSQPPVSLEGQLLWREFFYASAFATPNYDRMAGNPVCTQIAWNYNPEYIAAWTESRTGYPWIDACMAQLRKEGWIHHLARHAVACFLTRGDLYQSWEHGAKVFDRLLLDSDWALNNGNWMWLSASAYFHQFFRVYSPAAFPKKTDPNGDFIRKYLPQFATMPKEYIYEPWKAPRAVQEKHGVVVGVNYPERIVIHEDVHKTNIQRHTAAYAAKKTAGGSLPLADAGASGIGATQVASEPVQATALLEEYQRILSAHPRSGAAASATAGLAAVGAKRPRGIEAFLAPRGVRRQAAVVDLTEDDTTSTPQAAVEPAPRKRGRAAAPRVAASDDTGAAGMEPRDEHVE